MLSAAAWASILATLVCNIATASDQSADVGYESVSAARRAVANLPGVEVQGLQGWLVFIDRKNKATWTFAEEGTIGFPSVIRRRVIVKEGRIEIETRVLCESTKVECDDLVRRFALLDGRTRDRL